jgi:hypothetical protein
MPNVEWARDPHVSNAETHVRDPMFWRDEDRINLLAEATEGFRWRLQSDEGDATSLRPFGEDVIVNMSVWRDLASHDATGRAQASEQRSIALTADGVGIVDKSAPALGAFDVSSRAQPGLPIRRLA